MGWFGDSGYWCWIDMTLESNLRISLIVLTFYGELWIAIIFNIFCLFKVIQSLKKIQDVIKTKRFVRKLYLFPTILIVCWTPSTISRILSFWGIKNYYFSLVQLIFESFQGILNSIVFGFNENVRKNLMAYVCKKNRALTLAETNISEVGQNSIQEGDSEISDEHNKY